MLQKISAARILSLYRNFVDFQANIPRLQLAVMKREVVIEKDGAPYCGLYR
ncbi:hypothetical protein NTGHW29_120044 [Candidatus Nitrotoga sp. HW29]|nr:hypothetical protein NTGHW29_120044 [Candidatus Nitrotoga sp. HW29]